MTRYTHMSLQERGFIGRVVKEFLENGQQPIYLAEAAIIRGATRSEIERLWDQGDYETIRLTQDLVLWIEASAIREFWTEVDIDGKPHLKVTQRGVNIGCHCM